MLSDTFGKVFPVTGCGLVRAERSLWRGHWPFISVLLSFLNGTGDTSTVEISEKSAGKQADNCPGAEGRIKGLNRETEIQT